jgi:predicted Zn-dependent peptidase
VDVAWQALLDPAFRKEDIEATKKRRLSAILASRDDGLTNAINLFRTIAFNGHPYSLPSTGKEDAIRGASPADLRKWYDDHVHPENIRIIVVGDVDESDVEKKLSQLDFPKKGTGSRGLPASCVAR